MNTETREYHKSAGRKYPSAAELKEIAKQFLIQGYSKEETISRMYGEMKDREFAVWQAKMELSK